VPGWRAGCWGVLRLAVLAAVQGCPGLANGVDGRACAPRMRHQPCSLLPYMQVATHSSTHACIQPNLTCRCCDHPLPCCTRYCRSHPGKHQPGRRSQHAQPARRCQCRPCSARTEKRHSQILLPCSKAQQIPPMCSEEPHGCQCDQQQCSRSSGPATRALWPCPAALQAQASKHVAVNCSIGGPKGRHNMPSKPPVK
jgi:hypothetical protein